MKYNHVAPDSIKPSTVVLLQSLNTATVKCITQAPLFSWENPYNTMFVIILTVLDIYIGFETEKNIWNH